jgi:hypothetical protein
MKLLCGVKTQKYLSQVEIFRVLWLSLLFGFMFIQGKLINYF